VVFLALAAAVYTQLLFYGSWLMNFSIEQVTLVYSLMLATGLVATYVARMLGRQIFIVTENLPGWTGMFLGKSAQKLSANTPEILLSRTAGINAFAIGDLSHKGVIVLQQDIFRQLTQDEIEAVLAHELSHIYLHHAAVLTVLQAICIVAVLPLLLLVTAFIALIYGTRKFRSIFLILQNLFILVLFPLPAVMIAAVTRCWEYDADRVAASLVGKDRYIAALRCLHGSFFQHPNLLGATSLTGARIHKEGWALSHPGLMQRINALRDDG
jgi:heat shock protein HtpX